MSGLKIPFTGIQRQYNNLRSEILDATDTVLRSGRLMDGNLTFEFERWLAKRNSVDYAVTCHSGTQALEIIAAYYYLELVTAWGTRQPVVVVPAMTYPATLNAFARAGWQLIIADTDRYGQLDINRIPDESVDMLCAVGLYGQSITNMLRNANKPIARVVEDGAQHWLADHCIRTGDTAISFDPTKNLANYGNGGAVITSSRHLMEFAKNWISNGKRTNHGELGTNSRMSETDCAQMLVKTKYIDAWQARRRKIAEHWCERLRNQEGIVCLIDDSNIKDHCFHKFVITVDNRDAVVKNLSLRGVETRVHYATPMHELPAYQNYVGPGFISSASSLARRCLSLPIYPELTDSEVEYVIDAVLDSVS